MGLVDHNTEVKAIDTLTYAFTNNLTPHSAAWSFEICEIKRYVRKTKTSVDKSKPYFRIRACICLLSEYHTILVSVSELHFIYNPKSVPECYPDTSTPQDMFSSPWSLLFFSHKA